MVSNRGKKLKIICSLLILLTVALMSLGGASLSPVQAGELLRVRAAPTGPEEEYVPDQLIVKFKDRVANAAEEELNQSLGTDVIYTSHYAGFEVLQIPEGKTVSEMIELYSKESIVEYAGPNYIYRAFWAPNDPYYPYQWHFDQINLEAAWDLDTTAPNYGGDSSIVVAVLDTGVAYENYGIYQKAPDLANTNFVPGWDFVNNDAHPNDDESHGTHVCGTIVQSTNNALGVAGIAFNTAIMPIKVLDEEGSGTTQQIADGIYYAANNGAKIINMSLGGPGTDDGVRDALAYAYDHGVTIICAAGNAYQEGNLPQYPAAYDDYCIAVGAIRYDQTHAYYSNTGSYVDIVAPGGDTQVDQNGDGYGDGVLQQTFAEGDPTDFGYWFFQGTSMACPHVAGVAALILAKNPSFTPDQVRQALESTATDLGVAGRDDIYGWGLINAPAAVSWAVAPNNPPQLSNPSVQPPSGTPATDFYYFVNYFDSDGDSPSVKQVYIDGMPYTMSLYSGSASNGVYRYGPKNLSVGLEHNYYFYFEDDRGGTARLPTSGSYSGPTITTISLGEAVDNTGLTWTTGGNANWFGQTDTYYYDGDASQSGAITDSQSTWLKTTVTGPGTVSFYWKVSSESGYDFLRFYIDGVQQASISGSVDWQQKNYSISSGTHNLEWRYTKDVSVSSGSDCGWVDKVEFEPPTITVTSPNGGETWAAGSTHTISWTYTGNPGSYVKIELFKGGVLSRTISSSRSIGISGSGSYNWAIPSTQIAGSDYRVKITSTSNAAYTDTSNADFTITGPPPPTITVTSPNGGETWAAGSTQTISWTYTGNPGTYVKIELFKGGVLSRTIISSRSIGTGGSGSYNWAIPSNQVSGSDYRVKITSTSNAAYTDTSNADFTITGPPPPTITVTSPDGGETWAAGNTQTISWTYTGSPGTYVKIELFKGGVLSRTIISSRSIGIGGSGSYNWAIPSNQVSGTDYRVKITSTTNAAYTDTSNADFTIVPPPPSTITVTAPDGGETWAAGSTQTISWTYTGNPGTYVKIELFKGGVLSRTISSSRSVGIAGSGSYSWAIPSTQVSGSDYRVKITSTTNAAYTDTSNTDFTITGPPPPTITVTSPNGGETWAAGSTQTISWIYTGNPGSYVRIELFKGGVLSRTIISFRSIGTAGSGSYSWAIPSTQVSGTDYRIKITSNTGYSDTSNADFTIT